MPLTILSVNPYLEDLQKDLEAPNPDLKGVCNVLDYVNSVQDQAVFTNIDKPLRKESNLVETTSSNDVVDEMSKLRKEFGFGGPDEDPPLTEV